MRRARRLGRELILYGIFGSLTLAAIAIGAFILWAIVVLLVPGGEAPAP